MLKIKRLYEDAQLPIQGTSGSVGLDLHAYLPGHGLNGESLNSIFLLPGQRKLIKSGLAMRPAPGYFIRVLPRSGASLNLGLHVLAGVIDPDYTGDVSTMALNVSNQIIEIKHGMRIAQAVLLAYGNPLWQEVDELEDTARGASGFGSTGDGIIRA